MSNLLQAALDYSKMGFKVFPLMPRSKEPATAHGFKDASSDENQIRRWWSANPEYNIGLPTGTANGGIVVVDMDLDEEKGKFGYNEFKEWVDDNGIYIEDTWTAITGRGGYHFFFHSSTPVKSRANWLPAVDVRGEGGYVVAPPSVHPNGRAYEWEIDPFDVEIQDADADRDVFELIWELNESQGLPDGDSEHSKKFQREDVVNSGGRTSYLVRYIGQKAGQGLSEDEVRNLVEVENDKCNPPLSRDELEKNVFPAIARFCGRYVQKEDKKEEATATTSCFEFPALTLARDLQLKEIPDLNVFLGVGNEVPMIVEGTCVISAKSKTGKSWLCLNLCIACATGSDFLGMKVKKCHSLYLDLETGEKIAQNRLNKNGNGMLMPDGFYLVQESLSLGEGFKEMIEHYMENDPEIGIIVVDVFQKIRKSKKNNESDYEYTYRDMGVINELSHKYHISIILVCHDRKNVDPTDPFSNILGSTALQGASDQMIVMFKEKYDSPVTRISVKGRTMDGLIDKTMHIVNGVWTICDEGEVKRLKEKQDVYKLNKFRAPIVELVNVIGSFRGRCNEISKLCREHSIDIEDDLKSLGGFLSSCERDGSMEQEDKIRVEVIKNGNAPKIYKLEKLGEDVGDGFFINGENPFTIDGYH